jgi:hypothetical protein
MPAKALIDVDGTDAVSKVILTLLNEFPGLNKGQQILFATVDETSGIGFYPTSGAAYLRDNESITGHVTQACLYPFSVVYRAAPKSEKQRMRIKEFLDTLGKWLEKQPITIGDTTYQLDAYPALSSGNRVIKSISRSTPAFLNAAYQDGVEDWAISIRLIYENEFDR